MRTAAIVLLRVVAVPKVRIGQSTHRPAVNTNVPKMMVVVPVVVVDDVARYVPHNVTSGRDAAGKPVQIQSLHTLLIHVAEVVRNIGAVAAERAVKEVANVRKNIQSYRPKLIAMQRTNEQSQASQMVRCRTVRWERKTASGG